MIIKVAALPHLNTLTDFDFNFQKKKFLIYHHLVF